jgi:hypothetical protein
MKTLNNSISIFFVCVLVMQSITSRAQQAIIPVVNTENQVAILPMTYIGDGSPLKMEEMRYHLQNIAYLYMKKEAAELKFQDPAETNALLLKNGITGANIREFTPKELAAILQVEYILKGMVTQESTGELTVRNSNIRDYSYKNRYSLETHGRSRTTYELSTNIDLDVYNGKGGNIFSKSRRSILPTVNAYKNGLEYLLKRTPLYKR